MTAAASPSSTCCNKKYASCCPEKTADDENDAAHYHASKRQHEGMLREKGLPLVQVRSQKRIKNTSVNMYIYNHNQLT